MLSFEQKIALIEQFPVLERRDVSLGRVNYHYPQSSFEKKTVIYHLHPNGNGFLYAGQIPGASTDGKGFMNIRDCSADELCSLIAQAIESLTLPGTWANTDGDTLRLVFENELWYIYAGEEIEMAFETEEEAHEYLAEEGFAPA